jgi:hypothetical protein
MNAEPEARSERIPEPDVGSKVVAVAVPIISRNACPVIFGVAVPTIPKAPFPETG